MMHFCPVSFYCRIFVCLFGRNMGKAKLFIIFARAIIQFHHESAFYLKAIRMTTLSLHELNGLIRESIEINFPETYWVSAEITQINVASNGHCYLELIERQQKRGIIAHARAHIWRETYALLSEDFFKTTRHGLEAGMKILVEVEISFHEQYGYSLNIVDIDPTFSLGDMARRRQETIAQLQKDGVFNLNKELVLPRPLHRLAVISSASAAGYGDFMNQLQQSGYQFCVKLFQCSMQGKQVESDIIEALEQIAQDNTWEAVVIIRGGGSVADLNAFDSYELAFNVAQFPIPVITGIGHERDESVVDLVANMRLKTPTAVAAYVIDLRRQEYLLIEQLDRAIREQAMAMLQQQNEKLKQLILRYRVSQLRFLEQRRSQLTQLSANLKTYAHAYIASCREHILHLPTMLQYASRAYLLKHQTRLKELAQSMLINDPDTMLRRGYSITLYNGCIVKNLSEIKEGEKISTRLQDGTMESVVVKVKSNEKT